jgi:nicotinate-nucleotide adenylyltransferase
MIKIGLFPGTFNPIHTGHLILAEVVRSEYNLDKILFIPSNVPPHRDKDIASAMHRYNMVKLSCEDYELFDHSDIEITREGPSYTYDTLKELKENYRDSEYLSLIIGVDALSQLHTWNNAQDIVDITKFLILNRPGNPSIEECIKQTNLQNVKYDVVKAPLLEISSTMVRDNILKDKSIKFLVAEKVKGYIESHGLYRK